MSKDYSAKFRLSPSLELPEVSHSTRQDASVAGPVWPLWQPWGRRHDGAALLAALANGSAVFEYSPPPPLGGDERGFPVDNRFASISSAFLAHRTDEGRRRDTLFFAKAITRSETKLRKSSSEAVKKVEHYSVRKIAGDGRCMFRALVVGMAQNKGMSLSRVEEEQEADQLRLAVMDAICGGEKRRKSYEEALIAITLDESMQRYCDRISRPDFWGGEAELLVLSKMCHQPVMVYIPESAAKQGSRWGNGFIKIQEYGADFLTASKDRKPRKGVRLLYTNGNHYDLLT